MICKLYCPQVEGRHAEGGGRGGEAAEGSLDRVVALVAITRMLLESMDNLERYRWFYCKTEA
jgi:hypothetical protein